MEALTPRRAHVRRALSGVALAAGLLAAAASSGVELKPGDLVIGQAGYAVVRVDPASGAQEPIAGGGILDRVLALEVGKDGRIYALGMDYDVGPFLFRIEPSTGAVTAVARLTLQPGQAVPMTFAFDQNGSVVFFTNDTIHRVDLWTGTDVVIATLPSAPGWSRAIANAPDGSFFLSDADQGTLRRFDATTGTITGLASGLHLGGYFRSHGIAVDAAGFVVGPRFDPAEILRIDPQSGEEVAIEAGGDLADLWAIAVDRDGDLLVPSLFTGDITRIDSATGARKVIPTGFGITGFAMVPYPECDDRRDNDGDGLVDLLDAQCLTSTGTSEKPPKSCGLGFELAFLMPLLRRRRLAGKIAIKLYGESER